MESIARHITGGSGYPGSYRSYRLRRPEFHWGDADTMLLVFAGCAAKFALNRAVDWLFFTGKLPRDPIGRLFATASYAAIEHRARRLSHEWRARRNALTPLNVLAA